jgi:hypothetical protein
MKNKSIIIILLVIFLVPFSQPDIYAQVNKSVGSIKGSAGVSSLGAASYSMPIEIVI